ncbi:Nitrogen assimilation transcription factor nit-4, partial [Lachnellula suecica]
PSYPIERAFGDTSRRKFSDETLIRDLENKVRALESVIESQNGRTEELGIPARTPPGSNDGADDLGPENGGVRSIVAMEELAGMMLTMAIEDKGEPSFTISSRKYMNDAVAKPGVDPYLATQPTLQTFDAQSESREKILACFLENFNSFHQILEPDEVRSLVLQDPTKGPLDEQLRSNAVLAVGASLSSVPGAAELELQHASFAEGIILRCIREQPSDLVVQGLSLLSWRELQLGNDSMAYNYIAMATGQILHLGLHVTALGRRAQSAKNNNVLFRRRVRSFWAYFSIDRIVTSSLGMNCTMHWQRVKPPSYLTSVSNNISIDDIAHDRFCQLWHLWDSCMDQALAFGWVKLSSVERKNLIVRSHQALKDFYDEVNPQLSLQGEPVSGSAIWFQIAYHTAVLLIHRPFLNEPAGSFTLDFALRSATSAAASISRITRTYRKHSAFKEVLPQIIEYLLSAATIHLLNATSGRTPLGRQSANGLRCCLDALQDMEPKWEVRVQRAILRIRQLAHRWRIGWALPLCLSQPLQDHELIQEKAAAVAQICPPEDETSVVLNEDNGNTNYFDDYLVDFWDLAQYNGALEQINDLVDLPESWDFAPFLGDGNFNGSLEI